MERSLRRRARKVMVGGVGVGGGAPISVQSMTNTDTADYDSTMRQVRRLESAGCDIVRIAVPSLESVKVFSRICEDSDVPIVADVHFDYRIALVVLDCKVGKLRINPGNIGSKDRLERIVTKALERNVPIRIGVNAGSIEKDILSEYGGPHPEAMVKSCEGSVRFFESLGFQDIVISLKAFDIWDTLKAYKLMADLVDYPFHIGITEAGIGDSAVIRSAVGIGSLLTQGIGDTLRVSLTGDPVREVEVGSELLKSLSLQAKGITLVSCPTCGRCKIDLEKVASEVKRRTAAIDAPIKVAVMGCAVNGPGEARDADVGIAGAPGGGVLFKKGEIIKKVREEQLVDVVVQAVYEMASQQSTGL